MVKIVPDKLTGNNYEYWKVCLESYLMGQGLWGVVSGNEAEPQENDIDNYSKWKAKDAQALHAIQISCVGANEHLKIWEANKAKTAWDYLAKIPSSSLPLDEGSSRDVREEKDTTDYRQYETLHKALEGEGDQWNTIKSFFDDHPNALHERITAKGDTALHVAVIAGDLKVVKKLVDLMPKEDLVLKNKFHSTAIFLAAIGGFKEMVVALVEKNHDLVRLESGDRSLIPVIVASLYAGSEDTVRYLYKETPMELLDPNYENGKNGATLLNALIIQEMYDLALGLVKKFPNLGITEDHFGNNAIKVLAKRPSAFASGSKLVFWKRWIYSCIRLQESSTPNHGPCQKPTDEEHGIERSQQSPGNVENIIDPGPSFCGKLIWKLLNYFVPAVIKRVRDTKLRRVRALELLRRILKDIPNLPNSDLLKIGIDEAIYNAIKHGIVEFVSEIIKGNSQMVWRQMDKKNRTIFSHAIVLRQEKIFNLIYDLGAKKRIATIHRDRFQNNFLHLAGKLSPSFQLDRVSGPALQMQRELQWFKEVEKMVPPMYREDVNENDKTPSALFTDEHKDLVTEGEKWMKNTAASAMVVATLIAAVMFTTTFTLPGGTNNAGIPIFLGNNAFLVFIVSNSLSLFSSCTSLLMFLGILTARYAEKDFLKFLPTKLMLGLSTLFFSIVTMMIAFGSTLFIVLHERLQWVSIPIIILATIPASLYAVLQFPLLFQMFVSTYGRGIFGSKDQQNLHPRCFWS
ncbi:hypothetical protein L1049_021091 [Liquidambar formosana]|uniref:PGG domain-containing protein n=1 Tax=Liquidambar formosana TaxID=63359 RepID=A0AAP0SE05_LIQFO